MFRFVPKIAEIVERDDLLISKKIQLNFSSKLFGRKESNEYIPMKGSLKEVLYLGSGITSHLGEFLGSPFLDPAFLAAPGGESQTTNLPLVDL